MIPGDDKPIPAFAAEPGDTASITLDRSLLGWPGAVLLGHDPIERAPTTWLRHLYYRLYWEKASGARLDMVWRPPNRVSPKKARRTEVKANDGSEYSDQDGQQVLGLGKARLKLLLVCPKQGDRLSAIARRKSRLSKGGLSRLTSRCPLTPFDVISQTACGIWLCTAQSGCTARSCRTDR
jgi:hypothetical protein